MRSYPGSVDWSQRSRLRRDARSPKIDKQDRVDIRDRLGYKKILAICQQAKRDGYEWVWVDTCGIDKQSSVELSEAINSMYWWYENSKVFICSVKVHTPSLTNSKICYAYFHGVYGFAFSTWRNSQEYSKSNGWPEWFCRG